MCSPVFIKVPVRPQWSLLLVCKRMGGCAVCFPTLEHEFFEGQGSAALFQL